MAPASTEDQFNFLISCIRYSADGKVDFEQVANECGIVSKGAAAKRYERLMKLHGIHESQTSTVNNIRNSSVTSRKKKSSSGGLNKKRKLNPLAEANLNTDDDEGLPHASPESSNTKLKTERRGTKVKAEPVKKEPTCNHAVVTEMDDGPETKYREASPLEEKAKRNIRILQPDGNDDKSLMNDFLAFGAYKDQGRNVKVEMGGASVQDGLPEGEQSSGARDGKDIPESIVVVD